MAVSPRGSAAPSAAQRAERSTARLRMKNRYFIQKISLDDCHRFQELENLYTQSSDAEQVDTSSCSFKLGTELMDECSFRREQISKEHLGSS